MTEKFTPDLDGNIYLGAFTDTKEIVGDLTLEADGKITVRITHKEEVDYIGGEITFADRDELEIFIEKYFALRIAGKL